MTTSGADLPTLNSAGADLASIGTDLGGLGQGISGLGGGNPPQTGAALAAFGHDWGTGLARAGDGIEALAAIARQTAALFAAADSQG